MYGRASLTANDTRAARLHTRNAVDRPRIHNINKILTVLVSKQAARVRMVTA